MGERRAPAPRLPGMCQTSCGVPLPQSAFCLCAKRPAAVTPPVRGTFQHIRREGRAKSPFRSAAPGVKLDQACGTCWLGNSALASELHFLQTATWVCKPRAARARAEGLCTTPTASPTPDLPPKSRNESKLQGRERIGAVVIDKSFAFFFS